MRKWMRERAKRRKGTENTSESTGKIGQTIDPSQPAPLVPSYDAGSTHSSRENTVEQDEPAISHREPTPAAPRRESSRAPRRESQPRRESNDRHARRPSNQNGEEESEGRMEVETQPDSPSAPSESG